jgi:hypothetical protein
MAGRDAPLSTAASRLTSTYFGSGANIINFGAGAESQTLTLAQLPTGIASSNAAQAISVTSPDFLLGNFAGNSGSAVGGGTQMTASDPGSGAVLRKQVPTGNNSIAVTSNNTSGNAHPIVQPTVIAECVVVVLP